jgi:hypothetical protein
VCQTAIFAFCVHPIETKMHHQKVIDFVEQQIQSHKVVMFAKSWCRFTKKTRVGGAGNVSVYVYAQAVNFT